MTSNPCPQDTYIVRTVKYDQSSSNVPDTCANSYEEALKVTKKLESDYSILYPYDRYVVLLSPVEVKGRYRSERRILYSGAESFKE